MGKNQTYKALQRARAGSTSSAVADVADDGMVDGSFHSPAWHAARLASLETSHTITWEEYRKKQKEDEMKRGELEKDTHRSMREYRAQLDAERAHKLAQGRNHSAHRKDNKDKESKKGRKTKRRPSRESSSVSSSSDSDSDSEGSSRKKKSKRRKSKSEDGPVPLSKFFTKNT